MTTQSKDYFQQPVTSFQQLRDFFTAGARPREQWGVGAEMEKLVVDAETGEAARALSPVKISFIQNAVIPDDHEPQGVVIRQELIESFIFLNTLEFLLNNIVLLSMLI